MIISANSTLELPEFHRLLKSTVDELNGKAGGLVNQISNLSGTKLEYYAADIMKECAVNTPFEGSIECTPGQSFPDIIAKKYYGVEVKTTIKNHWKTTGNSVLESSRLADVERIFLLFGKLFDPIEFRCRPYEDCLSEVVVTHSPRYLIDMNLSKEQTIFDKINIPYDDLRTRPNPIREITNYYKKNLKKGDELWWLDQSEPTSSNLIVRLWSNLTKMEQETIKVQAFAFFPELISNSGSKYSRLAMWLTNVKGIVCPSLRDTFTSGGRENIFTLAGGYKNAPRILYNLHSHIEKIKTVLKETTAEELSKYWNFQTTEEKKFTDWLALLKMFSSNLNGISEVDLSKFLKELF